MAALDRFESDASKLRLRGVFTAADLAPIRDRTGDIARGSGFSETQIYRFVLAVSEAVANVIQHANGADGDLAVFVDGTALVAEVTDRGPGLVDMQATGDPGASSASGRGLWLMRQYVDEVKVASVASGTRVRLALRLPQAGLSN